MDRDPTTGSSATGATGPDPLEGWACNKGDRKNPGRSALKESALNRQTRHWTAIVRNPLKGLGPDAIINTNAIAFADTFSNTFACVIVDVNPFSFSIAYINIFMPVI